MKDRREINIEVFEDTMKHYKSNPTLKAAVSNSVANQKFTAAEQSRRRCYSRCIGAGRINLPLLDAVPLP